MINIPDTFFPTDADREFYVNELRKGLNQLEPNSLLLIRFATVLTFLEESHYYKNTFNTNYNLDELFKITKQIYELAK